MPDELARFRRAETKRRRAEDEYRAALLALVEAIGYAAAAKELGVSRQAVRQLVERSRR